MRAVARAVLLLGALLAAGCGRTPPGPRVVLIVIDTLRADHLGCYGDPRNPTPSIDRLAADAVLFENALATAPWTTPSVASMFTGLFPSSMGYADEPLVVAPELPTLAELFRARGCRTDAVISHTYIAARLGFARGFDGFDAENARWGDHISSPSVADKAIALLEANRDRREGFFLFVHCFDPHAIYHRHEGFDFAPDYAGELHSGQILRELRMLAPTMSDEDVAFVRALYASEVAFTDAHVGRLLDRLAELGLYDDALIVLTADHGEAFCERGDPWIGHTRTLFQELVRVPLLIKLPGGARGGSRVAGCVSLVDLMPTLADLAGLALPEGCEPDGRAWRLVADGAAGGDSGSRPVFSETDRMVSLRSVAHDGWKLIEDLKTGGRRLYDLRGDAGELRDVAGAHAATAERLGELLAGWIRRTDARRAAATVRTPEFTEEQRERLRTLGYVD